MTVQGIIEAHFKIDWNDWGQRQCQCGHEFAGKYSSKAHRAHVAEVLEKHMRERAVQAQVNALNGVASAWEEMTLPGAHHLYARMLRETANRIGKEPNGR